MNYFTCSNIPFTSIYFLSYILLAIIYSGFLEGINHRSRACFGDVHGSLSSAEVGKRIAVLGGMLAIGTASQGEIASQVIVLAEMLMRSSCI